MRSHSNEWIIDLMTIQRNGTCYDQGDGDTEDMINMAKKSLTDFQKSTSLHAINTIVFLLQALPLSPGTPLGHKFAALSMLADGLYARFHHSDEISDLDNAISSLQDAIECCIQKDRQQPNTVQRLSIMFTARFDFTSNMLDLQKAFTQFVDVKVTENSSAQGALSLLNSSLEILEQFGKSGRMGDLNTAVALTREEIMELPEGSDHYVAAVNNLASRLRIRFKQGGQQGDLNEAISLDRQVLKLQAPPHPTLLNNLASGLETRFEQGGKQEDLNEVISLQRQILELQALPHTNRCRALNNLANALFTRFGQKGQQGGQQDDLNEAISLHRQTLELRAPPYCNSCRCSSLNNLANALSTQFRQGGQQGDLNEAISLNRQALELCSPPDPNRPICLRNLASLLWTRLEQGGQQSDLNEAILLYRQALELFLPPHPNRPIYLNNLASLLQT